MSDVLWNFQQLSDIWRSFITANNWVDKWNIMLIFNLISVGKQLPLDALQINSQLFWTLILKRSRIDLYQPVFFQMLQSVVELAGTTDEYSL
jgi:hypothetical protein